MTTRDVLISKAYYAFARLLSVFQLKEALGSMLGTRVAKWNASMLPNPVEINGVWIYLGPYVSEAVMKMVANQYERRTTQVVRSELRKGMSFVDVGAHCGYFSMLAASIVGDGHVFAFEPDSRNMSLLSKARAKNHFQNLTLCDAAVANPQEETSTELFLFPASGLDSIVIMSGTTARVPLTSLDIYFRSVGWPRVDFVKIDVEGAEVAVIEGMTELCRRNPTIKIIVEVTPRSFSRKEGHGLFGRLHELGFSHIDSLNDEGPRISSEDSRDFEMLLNELKFSYNVLCSR